MRMKSRKVICSFIHLIKKKNIFHRPFFVTPDIGTLAVKDSMQITVEFKPLFAGDHNGEICLVYDTGQIFFFVVLY